MWGAGWVWCPSLADMLEFVSESGAFPCLEQQPDGAWHFYCKPERELRDRGRGSTPEYAVADYLGAIEASLAFL